MRLSRALPLLLLLSILPARAAEGPPSTDLWVGDLIQRASGWKIEHIRDRTNRDGYDNQPSFLPDSGALLYTSQRGNQTDIFEIDLASGAERRWTRTPESEYSPRLLPDGSGISVVRVESDGTQRIWRFPLDGSPPTPVDRRSKGIGYYAWLNASTLAAFVLGEPPTLHMLTPPSGEDRVVASAVGRCLQRVPGSSELSFTASAGGSAEVRAYDPRTGKTRRLAPAPPSPDHDFAWTPDGTLIAGAGSTLYRLRPGEEDDWVRFADLGAAGVRGITRLAVAPDGRRLAFVAER